jgi:hypothetical protein
MNDLLTAYFTADHLGSALVLLAVGVIFAVVKHGDRIRKESDG